MVSPHRSDIPLAFVYGGMIVILLIAFSLYQFALNDMIIDHDEEYEYSRILAKQLLWQIPFEDYELGRHVLALFWAKGSMTILGDTLFSLRWPSVCMSLLSIVFIFKIGTWLFGKWGGLVAAFLLAICPYAVFYAHNLRGYAGMIFYVLLAYYLALQAVQTGAWRYWFAVALSMGVAVYNHQYSALAWPGLFWLVFLHSRKQLTGTWLLWRQMVSTMAISLIGVLIAFMPATFRALGETLDADPAAFSSLFPVQRPSVAGSLLTSLSWFSGVNIEGMNPNPAMFYLTVALIALAVLPAIFRPQSDGVKLLLGWFVFPFAIYHASKLLIPTLWARPKYFGFTLPFVLLLVACAPGEIWGFLRRLLPLKRSEYYLISSLVLLVIAILWIPVLQEMFTRETMGNWPAVASYLVPRLEPTDIILCEPFDHDWGSNYVDANEDCRRNISYWVRANKVRSVYPILSLGEASDYNFLATHLQVANRFNRVWIVLWAVPPDVNIQNSDGQALPDWDHFGRTVLLPPPQNATVVEAMISHLERLTSLPHTPETQFTHHLRLAQLASILGQTDRAQEEWKSVEALRSVVPRFEKYVDPARQTIDRPPLLKRPLYPLAAHLGDTIRFEGFTLYPEQVVKPGDSVQLTLFWYAVQRPPADYTVFVHFQDAEGNVVFQEDFLPTPSTSGWWPGDLVWEERTFSVPAEMARGEYEIYTGMYQLADLERLPVVGQPSDDDSLFLGTLEVR